MLDPYSLVDGVAPIPLMTFSIDSPATEELVCTEDLQPLDSDMTMTKNYNPKLDIIDSLSAFQYLPLTCLFIT